MNGKTKKALLIILAVVLIGTLTVGSLFGKRIAAYFRTWTSGRNKTVMDYIRHPEKHKDWKLEALTRCGEAPFVLPTHGFIGYLYDDSFTPLKIHTGLDIFGGKGVGQTPVYAPYDGFLTRESDWKSSLILRIPEDPLNPGQQIWVYMTHLADQDGNSLIDKVYPAGTLDFPVQQGDLLGYQGNFSGNPGFPTGIHLHVSIVKDDGKGKYLNELRIENTLDPSPYFGFALNAGTTTKNVPGCSAGQ
ncbi:MAG: M23 family metallopeptidase [Anaerolineaceae bacterium]|jgi:murein DD-endopeptidase MepM/ murein hydrolase activator NlpD